MPIIEAHIMQGYDTGVKNRLSHGLTDAFRMVIQAKPEAITVLIHEMDRDNYMRGGAARRASPTMPDAADTVRRFHQAMAAGDFEGAEAFLTGDCVFVLPGGIRVTRPDQVASFTASRWSDLSTQIESIDTCPGPQGAIVYLRTLVSGAAADGAARQGVRAMQRLEFHGPLIARVDAMSDMLSPSDPKGPDAA